MKERGIIFNGEMVRAILSGRKTQTRREVKFYLEQSEYDNDLFHIGGVTKKRQVVSCKSGKLEVPAGAYYSLTIERAGVISRCPYQVGDRLYVRETFGFEIRSVGGSPHEQLVFQASKPNAVRFTDCNGKEYPVKWTPSIHMPKKYSRIWLEITDIRVERLNDISRADAIKEGATYFSLSERFDVEENAKKWFSDLWQSIYGAESWNANPWVWVIEFRVIDGRAYR